MRIEAVFEDVTAGLGSLRTEIALIVHHGAEEYQPYYAPISLHSSHAPIEKPDAPVAIRRIDEALRVVDAVRPCNHSIMRFVVQGCRFAASQRKNCRQ